jgi:thiol:disulfide interchange protein
LADEALRAKAAWSVTASVTSGDWHLYSDWFLSESVSRNKPVIIDFYANWCAPCRELDEVTFHHPDIVKLSHSFFNISFGHLFLTPSSPL